MVMEIERIDQQERIGFYKGMFVATLVILIIMAGTYAYFSKKYPKEIEFIKAVL